MLLDQVEALVVGVLFDSVVLDSVFLEVVSTQPLLLEDGVGKPPYPAEEEVVLTSLVLLLVDQES